MRCPICSKYRGNKSEIIKHMEREHREQLPKDISTYRYAYMLDHGRDYGLCVVCGAKTKWNEVTQKPDRLCGNIKCRENLRSIAKKNMDRVYGEGNYPVNNPEFQKLMLRNRKTSRPYKFKDGGEVIVASTDEYELLKYLETVLEFTSSDVIECPYVFYYNDKGVKRSYIPDFYLPNLNLIIEQKDDNNTNPKFLEETRYKVKLKLEAVKAENKYNYIIVYGKKYEPLMQLISEIKEQDNSKEKEIENKLRFIHNETASIPFKNKLYFGIILNKDSESIKLFLTEHFGADIIYCGVDDNTILPRTLKDFYDVGQFAQVYEISQDNQENKNILNEFKSGIILKNMNPDEFILENLRQKGINIHITSNITNNTSGETDAHLVNIIKFKSEEKENEF